MRWSFHAEFLVLRTLPVVDKEVSEAFNYKRVQLERKQRPKFEPCFLDKESKHCKCTLVQFAENNTVLVRTLLRGNNAVLKVFTTFAEDCIRWRELQLNEENGSLSG